MRYPEKHYTWTWRLKASPAQLWPLVSDTNRFNRDAGLPAVELIAASMGANARRSLKFSAYRMTVEWEEEPFEWVRLERFGVRRHYRCGPIDSVRVLVQLKALEGGGTELTYETWLRPRSLLALIVLPLSHGVRNRRRFERIFHGYDEEVRGAQPAPSSSPPLEFVKGGHERLRTLQAQTVAAGADADLTARLVDFIETADALTLAHVRPYSLADNWRAPRSQVLELFLRATRAGIFDLQWDLLCPLCRGTKATASALSQLQSEAHCETCNIDISSDLEQSIELTFGINSAIKEAQDIEFCVAGPQVTPHIVAQQLLQPHESRELRLALDSGRHRLRALGVSGGKQLETGPEGAVSLSLVFDDDGWPDGETRLASAPTLTLENRTDSERLFILERLAWSDQAVTAGEVIRMQAFRDLFSGELLRPGQQISIASLTIAFTDLRDSTNMYQKIGDAPAFGRVLDHFAVLREEILATDGAIVKTIGDAVMAVFPRPVNGVLAMLRSQARLNAMPAENGSLRLKAGLHQGACIAVTLNERLDYFGSVINLAARLERFSTGKDVIISEAVYKDPEVQALIADSEAMTVESFASPLKGFDDSEFRL